MPEAHAMLSLLTGGKLRDYVRCELILAGKGDA